MKNIEEIKQLMRTAKALETLEDRYNETIKDPSCDKFNLSFSPVK